MRNFHGLGGKHRVGPRVTRYIGPDCQIRRSLHVVSHAEFSRPMHESDLKKIRVWRSRQFPYDGAVGLPIFEQLNQLEGCVCWSSGISLGCLINPMATRARSDFSRSESQPIPFTDHTYTVGVRE